MATMNIGNRIIGDDHPTYIIAEVSCNHEGDKEEAKKIIKAAADAGADAVKLQTYTPDTISRNFDTKPKGTIWEDIDLHALYGKAYTPWEWSHDLQQYATDLGVDFFSSPFDETAVDFLVDELNVPVLKVASFEVVDTKLLAKMAKTGLPIIMSNGMTDLPEIEEAIKVLRDNGCTDLTLLHCNSGYPAAFNEANLKTMQDMKERFGTVVGVSDHTLFAQHDKYEDPMAHITPVEAVRLGGKVIEVHLMLDRVKARALFEDDMKGGFDWPFSMEQDEFKKMVDMVRQFEKDGTIDYDSDYEHEIAESTHGKVNYHPTEKELNSRNVRPSLWVTKDLKAGENFKFAAEDKEAGNFDSIRPAGGLHIRETDKIEGKVASRDLRAGQPLAWDMIA